MSILRSLLLFCIMFFSAFQAFAYELTENDNAILDNIEDRLFVMIDENDSLTAQGVEKYIESALERDYPERTMILLEIILDDLRYEYSIWEYSTMMSEDQCYEDEYFDAQDQQCYYNDEDYSYDDEEDYIDGDYRDESDFEYSDEWHDHGVSYNDNEEENYDGEDYYDDEEEYGNEDYSNEWYSDEQGDNEQSGWGDEMLATYTISGDSITLKTGTTSQQAEDAWKTFATIIPAGQREDFKLYSVFDNADDGTAAFVVQDNDDHVKWNLAINLPAVYEGEEKITKEGIATLVHEFTHVLTLNKWQMRYLPQTQDEGIIQRFEENCATNFVQEGCLNETAYLDDFIDTFWTDKAVLKKAQQDGESAYTDATADNFITEYAGTNPGEDISESFTYFVLNVKPTGNKISDQKLNFFYNYKELESLRKQIRTQIDTLSK